RGRRAQTAELVDEHPVGGAGATAGRQLARAGVKRLYAALDEPAAASRHASTRHEADGRPLAEVAGLGGSSVTATKLRVWRARKRLEAAAAADPILREFLQEGV